MLAKYTIEYIIQFKNHPQTSLYSTDDPVACEEFLAELLKSGFRIVAIRRDGLDLPSHEFDKVIRTAAGIMASRCISESLGIDTEEERFRFRFAA